MKNYFYWNDIALRVQEILTNNIKSLGTIKKIVTGDFCLLPTPSTTDFYNFFPCVLIETDNMELFYDNRALDTTTQDYSYSIYYIYPYGASAVNKDIFAQEETKLVANILMNYRTLDNFQLPKSENQSGFVVIDSEIKSISFDNEIKQLFLNMEVPLSVSLIKYIVTIKTLRKG